MFMVGDWIMNWRQPGGQRESGMRPREQGCLKLAEIGCAWLGGRPLPAAKH
jgi:hypothetical protein